MNVVSNAVSSFPVAPVISVGPDQANPCTPFYCGAIKEKQCCTRASTEWHPSSTDIKFSVSVYGEEPVEISFETVWDESNHYPIDLQIELLNTSTTIKASLQRL